MSDEDFDENHHRQLKKKIQQLLEKAKQLLQQIEKLSDACSYNEIVDDQYRIHALKWLQRDAEDDLGDDLTEPTRNFKRELSLSSLITMVDSIEEVTMDPLIKGTKAGISQSAKREYEKLLCLNQEVRRKVEDLQRKIEFQPQPVDL